MLDIPVHVDSHRFFDEPSTVIEEEWNETTTWVLLQILLGIYDIIIEQEDDLFEREAWINSLDLFKDQLDGVASRPFIEALTVDKIRKKWKSMKAIYLELYEVGRTDWPFYNEVGHVLKNSIRADLAPLQRERTIPERLIQERVIQPLKGPVGTLDVSYDQLLEIHRQQNEWFLSQQDQFFERFQAAMGQNAGNGQLMSAFHELQLKRKAMLDMEEMDYKRTKSNN